LTQRRLSVPAKLTFGLGELTLNAGTVAVTMLYAYFPLQEAGVRRTMSAATRAISASVGGGRGWKLSATMRAADVTETLDHVRRPAARDLESARAEQA
jgi:hypothetical protein